MVGGVLSYLPLLTVTDSGRGLVLLTVTDSGRGPVLTAVLLVLAMTRLRTLPSDEGRQADHSLRHHHQQQEGGCRAAVSEHRSPGDLSIQQQKQETRHHHQQEAAGRPGDQLLPQEGTSTGGDRRVRAVDSLKGKVVRSAELDGEEGQEGDKVTKGGMEFRGSGRDWGESWEAEAMGGESQGHVKEVLPDEREDLTLVSDSDEPEHDGEGVCEAVNVGIISGVVLGYGRDREWDVQRKRCGVARELVVVENGARVSEGDRDEDVAVDSEDDGVHTSAGEESVFTDDGQDSEGEPSDAFEAAGAGDGDRYARRKSERGTEVAIDDVDPMDCKKGRVKDNGDITAKAGKERKESVLRFAKGRASLGNISPLEEARRDFSARKTILVRETPDVSTVRQSKEEINAAIKWIIRDFPPPLSGPRCTCKVPGTPPWKLAQAPAFPLPGPPSGPPGAAYAAGGVAPCHHQTKTEIPRPRSASFTFEAGQKKEGNLVDDKNVFRRNGKTGDLYWRSPKKPDTYMGAGNRDIFQERTFENDVAFSPEISPAVMRRNAKDLKEKRRILRSWSFWSPKPSQDDYSNSPDAYPSSSLDSSYSSASSPLCSYSAFSTLTTPRRWSRVLGEKRKRVQSCIFPTSYTSQSVGGRLSTKVRSEPNVTSKRRVNNTCSQEQVSTLPRRMSKSFSYKRRLMSSCLFSDTVSDDSTPYTLAPTESDAEVTHGSNDGVPGFVRRPRSSGSRYVSCMYKMPEFRNVPTPDAYAVQSVLSRSQFIGSESHLIESESHTPVSEVRMTKYLSRKKRSQSLIITPESQTGRGESYVQKPESSFGRPEPLVVPTYLRIPRRNPRLIPPESQLIRRESRALSQGRIPSRDPREVDRHLRRSLDPDYGESLEAGGHVSLTGLKPDVPRAAATTARRECRRKNARSWSSSLTVAEVSPPEGGPYLAEGRSQGSVAACAVRTVRPRTLFPGDSRPLCSPAVSPSVIFPWRRSEHSRSSGRSSPAPYDATSQLPATSPSCSQSPSCAHPADSANSSSCEVASEPKRKDGGVWWRGRAGVSRTTRREKASSSPVFRRASLSHSEWDIRRPWSHVYSEREAAKLSQSVCRLAMTSVEDGGVPGEVVPEGEGPRSLPYMPSNMQSSTEGMFQKFKKSLSLRLAKKGSRSESPSSGSHSAPIDHTHSELTLVESQTLPRRRGSITRDDDNKTSFLFGHPLFRSSKERRRARLKDVRSSKCNSGDSGDSGIELVTTSGQVTSLDMTSHSVDLDGGTYVDPAFMASLAEDGGSSLREVNPRTVRRTHSDVGGAGGRGCVHYSRQLSTPQPIKIRPAHRLPQHTASLHRSKSLKRSKGSSHLRRSVSQPLDLDRAYDTPTSTLRKCRSPSNTSNRRQRRPSAGNILNEDNTTSEDEIGMSDSEDFRTDLKRSLEEDDDMIVYAEALWDHVTLDSEELVFKAGDLITVIDSSDKDWWWGRISHRAGWFPAAFVRILVNQEDHLDSRSHDDARLLGPARKLSISGLSHDQIRTNVINEIISTERDFVKHLRDVVKGYLRQVRKRPDMFSDERISTIFGNMEALYQFQSNFLRELEMCIDWQDPHKSCIGAAFTRNREKFEIYSEYCNNHPAAMSSLQELYQDQKYIHFFEACRLLQEMIDISLDGFLLTPVQKICKYPLQLQELLKYTKPDHPDYSSVQGALEAMRDVALLVNERKRRMECLEKIASWQITVEGWEGPELLEDSSQLIYQGEVTKGVGGSWPKDVTLFLFDHQLVYCKRDLLKRNTFVYRGRLNLDVCEIVDLPDGKDSSLNISVHNGWKIHSLEKNKWYVFSCKTATEKHKWMEAFRKERKLVAADESAGFVVAEKAKHLAKVAARNQRNRPKRPRSLWFSFGGHKKGRGSGRNVSQTQHHPV